MFNSNRKFDVERAEKKFKEQLEEEPLEKKDILALIIAGLIISIPVMAIVTAIIGISYWIFLGRFM